MDFLKQSRVSGPKVIFLGAFLFAGEAGAPRLRPYRALHRARPWSSPRASRREAVSCGPVFRGSQVTWEGTQASVGPQPRAFQVSILQRQVAPGSFEPSVLPGKGSGFSDSVSHTVSVLCPARAAGRSRTQLSLVLVISPDWGSEKEGSSHLQPSW